MKLRKIKKHGRVRFAKKKPKIAKCGICKKPLKGVLREKNYKMRNIAKTKKRPERKYSNLCSRCSREKIRQEVRENV